MIEGGKHVYKIQMFLNVFNIIDIVKVIVCFEALQHVTIATE